VARLIVLDESTTKEKKSSTIQVSSTESPSRASTTALTALASKPIVHLSAPVSLRLLDAQSRSLKISWQPPSIAKEIPRPQGNTTISYRITWKATGGQLREATTSKTEFLIGDLTADTVYRIEVCAVLSESSGPQAFLEAKTSGELKLPGPPVDLSAEFVDFGYQKTMSPTLKFRWKRPVELTTSPITKYRLFYEHLHYGPARSWDENTDSGADSVSYYNGDQYAMDEYDVVESVSEKFLDIETPPSEVKQESSYEFLLEDLKKYSTYRFRLVAVDAFMERENITGHESEGRINYFLKYLVKSD